RSTTSPTMPGLDSVERFPGDGGAKRPVAETMIDGADGSVSRAPAGPLWSSPDRPPRPCGTCCGISGRWEDERPHQNERDKGLARRAFGIGGALVLVRAAGVEPAQRLRTEGF